MDFSHLTSVALSDVGRKRKHNEDSILSLPEAGVFCVADGMGGAAGGELASRWTVEAIQDAFHTGAASPRKTVQVRQALNNASRRIKVMAEDLGVVGAGTTAVVLFFDDYQPDRATVLHAGDSRVYRIRNGLLECLTSDHSLAASAGLPHDRYLPSMFRGIITRAIGLDNTVELDESVVQVKAGDCFLLCSDGLTKMLSDPDIQNLIHTLSDSDLTGFAATLVDAANHAGGDDNISIILIRVESLPAPMPRPAASADDQDTAEKAETENAAVPAVGSAGPDQPEVRAQAGGGAEPDRPSETEDAVVGVTPQSGHGSTPAIPAPTPPHGGAPEVHRDASVGELMAAADRQQPVSAGRPPSSTPEPLWRATRHLWRATRHLCSSCRSWLIFVLVIIVLAAAYYIKTHY